jgi:hypothetical protein
MFFCFSLDSDSVSGGALLRAVRVVMVRYVLMAPPPPSQQQPLCLLSKITLGPNNYISQFIACHIYCVQDAERLYSVHRVLCPYNGKVQ